MWLPRYLILTTWVKLLYIPLPLLHMTPTEYTMLSHEIIIQDHPEAGANLQLTDHQQMGLYAHEPS